MSENSSEQEPSIEEILASIRQIISDDDEAEVAVKDDKKPEEPLESPVHDSSDDILELSEDDLVDEEPEEVIEAEPEIEEVIEEPEEEDDSEALQIEMRDRLEEIRRESEARDAEKEMEPPMVDEVTDKKPIPSEILSSSTQAAALGSLSKLATKMPINSSRSYDGVTLEDIVREMLHPMLREWMDDNLAPMVERTVQKELEKLARRAMDD